MMNEFDFEEFKRHALEKLRKQNENLNLIEMVESGSLSPGGSGVEKVCYPCGDKVILKTDNLTHSQVYHKCKAFYINRIKNNILRKLGVQTPMLIFCTSKKTAEEDFATYYEIQERAKGNIQNGLKCSTIFEHVSSLANGKELGLSLTQLSSAYSNQITIHRALTGQKFLNQLMENYFTLFALGAADDVHSENIFYSAQDGYTFIDLSLEESKSFANKDEALAIIDSFYDISSMRTNPLSNTAVPNNGIAAVLGYLENALGIYNNIKTPDSIARNFEQYVYNGVIAKQALNHLEKSNNPIVTSNIDFIRTFNTRNVFALDWQTITELNSAIQSHDEVALQGFRETFNLGNSFNFYYHFNTQALSQMVENTIKMQDSETCLPDETSVTLNDNGVEFSFE